jgi:hypothetical protein
MASSLRPWLGIKVCETEPGELRARGRAPSVVRGAIGGVTSFDRLFTFRWAVGFRTEPIFLLVRLDCSDSLSPPSSLEVEGFLRLTTFRWPRPPELLSSLPLLECRVDSDSLSSPSPLPLELEPELVLQERLPRLSPAPGRKAELTTRSGR